MFVLLPLLCAALVAPATAALAADPQPQRPLQPSAKPAGGGLLSTLRAAVQDAAHPDQAPAGRAKPSVATPASTPSGISVGGNSGVIGFTATSGAPFVEFLLDGNPLAQPIAVSAGGAATFDFSSWGYSNGTHVVSAADCADATEATCDVQAAASTSFDLENAAPRVTGPQTGATVTGGFTITATSSGGGVAFLIDGSRRGFDGSAPYSFAYTGSALSGGSHSVQVVSCSTDGARCGGPQSGSVWITSNSLHPTITSLYPSYISPNGDGVRDETTLTFSLPDTEDVYVSVKTTGGQRIRGPVALGTLGAGSHQWMWRGGTSTGAIAPQGTYYVVLDTSRTINGAVVRGEVSRSLVLDLSAPQIYAGAGGPSVYPVVDGYRDYVSFGWIINERSTVTLRVADSYGRTVRTISELEDPGRHWLHWWGHDDQGRLLAAGTYHWWVTATDTAGNSARGGDHYFTLSLRHLVSHTTYIYRNADWFTQGGASDTSCAEVDPAASVYPHGVWFYNTCDPYYSYEVAATFYRIKVPAAVHYTHLGLSIYGSTILPPAEMGSAFGVGGNDSGFGIGGPREIDSYSEGWWYLGGVGSGYVRSDHTVSVSPFLDDVESPCDFDAAQIRLGVTYEVLQ